MPFFQRIKAIFGGHHQKEQSVDDSHHEQQADGNIVEKNHGHPVFAFSYPQPKKQTKHGLHKRANKPPGVESRRSGRY
jgi:hypothetical protein